MSSCWALLLVICLAAGFQSCEKDDGGDDNNNNNNNTAKNEFVVTVQENLTTPFEWKPETVLVDQTSEGLAFEGKDADGKTITFVIKTDKTGTYVLNAASTNVSAFYKNANGDFYIGTNGTFIISEWDMTNKIVSGTFEFTGAINFSNNTAQLTKGSFDKMKYE